MCADPARSDPPLTRAATGTATVRVPATSANLGPGFDALGLALALYDDVTAEVRPSGLQIDVTGEGAAAVPRDDAHLVVRAIDLTLSHLGAGASGLALQCDNHIPHGRGLGSSAAAICAGVLLARALVPGAAGEFDDEAVLALAARIEGHPDNVAACLLGGLTVAWTPGPTDPGGPQGPARARRVEPAASIRPVVFIPPDECSTAHARGLLPATVSHGDAAFNAARAALLMIGLTSDGSVLLPATADRLHQPYRAPAMPDSSALVVSLRSAGIAAVVSGAGPTVLALATTPASAGAARALAPAGWRAEITGIDLGGAIVRVGRG